MRARCVGGTTLRLGAAIVLSGPLYACTSWQVQPVPPAQLVEQRRLQTIQVRRQDGSRTVLESPALQGDFLIGVQRGDTTRVALGDVTAVALRRFDWGETAGLTVVTAAAVFAIACAIGCDHGGISFAE